VVFLGARVTIDTPYDLLSDLRPWSTQDVPLAAAAVKRVNATCTVARGTKMTRSPETYIKIVTVLVPIYAVVIIGWLAGASACDLSPGLCGTSRAQRHSPWVVRLFVAGRFKAADEFMLDRLNAFNAKFALPALLFRTIAVANLYDADWNILSASLTLKLITAVLFAAYAYVTRSRFGALCCDHRSVRPLSLTPGAIALQVRPWSGPLCGTACSHSPITSSLAARCCQRCGNQPR
jgi:Membrane transport protein